MYYELLVGCPHIRGGLEFLLYPYRHTANIQRCSNQETTLAASVTSVRTMHL